MYRYETARRQERDEEDNLIGETVAWTQEREWMSEVLSLLLQGLILSVIFVVYLAYADPPAPEIFLQGAGAAAVLAVLLFFFGHLPCTIRYELCFLSNGVIYMPFGQYRWFMGKFVYGDHRNLMTIQAQPAEDTGRGERDRKPTEFEVWLYYSNGWAVCVAERMSRLEANHVTALLTHALADMRSGMARLPQAARSAQSDWGHATVD